ncbi:MAG TPA: cytochrome b [Castellaniella sp.]|uniref:cytochrome b n=1 Tax=Castellaniella sp. TaxID=1955812 RepID=UPI002F0A296B
MKAQAQRYHPALKALHWLIALLVCFVLPLGLLQKVVKEDVYGTINFWHVNLGFTVFLLMLIRLAVRVRTGVPASSPGTPSWAARLGILNHRLLYLALIIEPILGYFTTNAQGFPLDWFDVIPIWSPFGKFPIADSILAVHLCVAFVIIALVVLHVCGALYHRLVRRDGALARMT